MDIFLQLIQKNKSRIGRCPLMYCLFFFFLICISSPILAQNFDKLAQLNVDGQVAIDSNHAVISKGSSTKIYHYDGNNWVLEKDLNVGCYEQALDINNNRIIIGNRITSGGVCYIYHYIDGHWTKKAEISAPLPDEGFGYDVAIYGDFAVVGAPWYIEGSIYRGGVYIYQYNGISWDYMDTVFPTDSEESLFGYTVEINQTKIIVGAPNYIKYIDPEPVLCGAAYLYTLNTGTTADFEHLFVPSDGHGSDEYGRGVAVEENHVVIGSPFAKDAIDHEKGAIYFYSNNGTDWTEQILVPPLDSNFGQTVDIDKSLAITAGGNNIFIFKYEYPNWNLINTISTNVYGYFVALSNKTIINSISGGDEITNIYELIARPGNVKADDGKNVTAVNWDTRSTLATDYNIYRNGKFLKQVGSGEPDYTDNIPGKEPIPGKIYNYSVTSYNSTWGESNKVYDYGWQMSNGEISGNVSSQPPEPVPIKGVKLTAYCRDLSGSLDLTDNDTVDYAICPEFTNFPHGALTVSFWMKSSDNIYTGTPISYAVEGSTNHFMIYDYNNFQIHLGGTATISTGISATDGLWNHIAVTWDSTTGQLNFYKNGQSVYDTTMGIGFSHSSGGTLVLGQEQDKVGGGFDKNQSYVGYLAEVQIWNIKKTETGIQEDMNRILHGNENGLVAYWRFHEGKGSVGGDFAKNGGHHLNLLGTNWSTIDYAPVYYSDITNELGNYYLTNIYYDSIPTPGAQFTVKPDTTGGRSFNPNEENEIYLRCTTEPGDYQKGPISFTDTSAFSISGLVQFDNLNYNLPGVKLFIDNASVSKTMTNASGTFAFPLNIGPHIIKPQLFDHTFIPAETTLTVNSAISDIVFKDTTHYVLSGKVAGGGDGYYLGEATIVISGPNNCFSLPPMKTINGVYSVKLPAIPDILLTVTEINDQPVNEVFTNGWFEASKTISLVEGDTTLDFIYYAEPRVVITGLPDPTTIYNVPVLEQMDYASINIKIVEDYGNERISMADSGTINIINDITNETTYSDIEITESQYYPFLFRIGVPNIIPGGSHPFQKRLYLNIETRGGEIDTSICVIVTGYRPREQTFATVSPAIPLLILHDPPGDHSYSYLEKSLTTSFTTSMSMLKDKSKNKYETLKAGVAVGVSYNLGWVSISQETAVWAIGDSQLTIGSSALNQDEQQYTITTQERFETSSEETDIGAESDVFIGAAFNIIYALADILEINDIGEIELSKSIIYGLDNEDAFETTYIYTQRHIEDILLPRFEENLNAETDLDGMQYWKDQIEAWQQIVALNDSLKMSANEPVGGQSSISISGGTAKYYSTTLEQSISHTIEFNSYINSEVAFEAGLEIFGSGYKQGVQVRTRLNIGKSERTEVTKKQTIGYCIYDNEYADNFWIAVKGDPVYGTPVFKLQQGCYTSWPWEKGTIAHEKCKLDIDGDYIQHDINPTEEAVFKLELTNISPSGQTGTYKLFHIPTSNPDGAQLQIFGDPISTVSAFPLFPNEPASIPLAVKMGPYAYDYEDLKVAIRSVGDAQIADTVTFSVHFTAPCSPIRIQEPEDSWIVSKSKNDSLKITLMDYDKSKMTTLMIQYRPKNDPNWENGSQFTASSLPNNSAVIYWNTKGLAEGEYELRTRVSWNQATGYTYSNKVKGMIDRIAPQILGKPQPADGVLHPGDNISVKFNEDIDKTALSTDNITLRNSRTGSIIPIEIVASERKVVITPTISAKTIENQNLQVSLINIQDQYGNSSGESIVWPVYVNQNPVYWNTSKITKTALEGESCTFWAKLRNDGNENVYFNLNDLPWLGADMSNGWINTGEETVIQFNMDPGLTSGYYRDTLFAEMSKGDELLILDIHIQNKPPNWTFDPGAFSYNMTLTAGFYIDDIPFSEENDIVAAFIGDTLCGKVKVQKMVPQDEYVSFLMVHSNKVRTENVSLVIWDASEGQERSVTEKLTFVADTSYGKASNPDSLHISGALLQTIHLADNWSWFSLAVEARDMSASAVLDRLRPGNGDLVKGHTSYAQYLPGTGWVGGLDSLRIGNGFKIKLTAIKDLNYIGDTVTDIHWPIEVESGWNWIGYLPDETLNINTALASLNATVEDGDQIKNEDSFATYNTAQSMWVGTLEEMRPGEAYMLKVANTGLLNYPGLSGKKITLAKFLSAKTMSVSAPDWQVDASTFEHSMNVTSALTIDGLPVVNSNTILAAFINEECRGISKSVFVRDKWMFFSTIFSNVIEDDSVQFRVYDADNDQVRDVDVKVDYIADKIAGTPASPIILWIGIPTGLEDESELPREFALEQNYPNPFNPVTTIRYALKQAEDVKLILYDILGQKVRVLVNEPQKAGWYDIQLKANDLASGVYIYRIKAGKFVKACKMIVMK